MVDYNRIRELGNITTSGWAIKLVAAISILLIGLVVARITSKLVHKLLHELEVNRILKEQAGVKIPVEEFLSSITKYLVYFIAVVMALSQLGLETFVFYIILIIILAILVAFIILAFKDFIPNITAGFFIHHRRMIRQGDKIKIRETEGEIINVSLIETQIKTMKGDIVYIPNSVLTKNEMVIKKRKS